MTDLRPCPFCGGNAHIESDEYYSGILCDQCGYGWSFEEYEPAEEITATAQWNTRPIEDALLNRALTAEARVAQLERAIAADPLESERLRALIAEALDLLRAGVDPGEYAQSVWVSQIVATLMEADNGSPRPTPPEP